MWKQRTAAKISKEMRRTHRYYKIDWISFRLNIYFASKYARTVNKTTKGKENPLASMHMHMHNHDSSQDAHLDESNYLSIYFDAYWIQMNEIFSHLNWLNLKLQSMRMHNIRKNSVKNISSTQSKWRGYAQISS